MKSAHINPFLTACTDVFMEATSNVLERKEVTTERIETLRFPVTVFLGIAGPLWGQVFYCFEKDTARRTAGKMMGLATPPAELDELSLSAVAELGNIMTGRAIHEFEKMDLQLILTPPSVLLGDRIEYFFSIPTVNIHFTCPFGDIVASVGLVDTQLPPEAPIVVSKKLD
ncbi:MAG: chemotaxis protein CheX [Candidatus Omnitrophica bacterium]|nr:chemotaxis protein CheX [Candidatus Omnitrophota bacterium]MCA9447818.1 chemotaxis protein CheX [Candidatus Omnitrophota bacterium]MCB9769694.1 chemotaxis protein CheX [Candidatus Omnitrophota bacterium]MCB9782081.1 chemotaxis protein CheX [Candidatus Omnitrophota bacterium]